MRILLTLFLIWLSLCLNAETRQGKAVVFDAGSSGTRVFVYDWTLESGQELVTITLPPKRVKKINGGLTSFSKDTNKIPDYLHQLINFAKTIVGENHIKTTPLYFAATAGLRLEEQRNPEGYKKIINKVTLTLDNSGFVIADKPRTISGQEEAAYAWVNINSLEKQLPQILSGEGLGIGVVEMGGASFQIAFLPKEKPKEHAFIVNLAGKHIALYAYSYGDLGENEARKVFSNDEYCEWGGKNHEKVGSFDKCRESILKNIAKLKGQECANCGIGPIFQPRIIEIANRFYGVGSLGFLRENFDIKNINAQNLRRSGIKICDVPFEQAVKEIPKLKDKINLIKQQCFSLSYFSAVLTGHEKIGDNALGFPGNTTKLIAKQNINGQEISWTYGLLMLEIGKFLAKR